MLSWHVLKTWGYVSGLSASARTGIPSRRTASKNSGHRSSEIVEQKLLARNLVNENKSNADDDAGSDIGSNS